MKVWLSKNCLQDFWMLKTKKITKVFKRMTNRETFLCRPSLIKSKQINMSIPLSDIKVRKDKNRTVTGSWTFMMSDFFS